MKNVYLKLVAEFILLLITIFGVVLVMAMFTPAAAQTDPNPNNCTTIHGGAFVYSKTKTGKVSHKECEFLIVCDHAVEFRATATSVQTFYKITESKWESMSGKVVTKQVDADGTIVFWTSETKAFYYKPNKQNQ